MTEEKEILITCRDLAVGYDGEIVARGLNFTVSAGDYLCIVGENGSGKSTLMRTLLSLQPPIEGEILFGGKRCSIGYLPQQKDMQKDFPASVREIVLSGCLGRMGQRPFFDRESKRRADETMERLGISEYAARSFSELSGGQQQRVLLARALCATEKLLLLDEPVTGLDPKATSQLYQLISGLNRDGITIIMISHDIATALTYATHILHVGNGGARGAQEGAPATSFFGTSQAYERSGIGRLFLKGSAASRGAAQLMEGRHG